MNETLLHYLSSWQFWFASVAVGLAINIASHYLIKRFGGFGEKFSKALANRNNASKLRRQKKVNLLVQYPDLIQRETASAIRDRLNHIAYLVIVCVLSVMAGQLKEVIKLDLIAKTPEQIPIQDFFLKGTCVLLTLFCFMAIEAIFRSIQTMSVVYEAENIIDKSRVKDSVQS